jgi:hypothetical protein
MIKPIVEGYGEVRALPELLRRIAWCYGVWDVPLLTPGRYPASQILRRENAAWIPGAGLEKAGGHARNEGAHALLILLDADDLCAKEVAGIISPQLVQATGFESSRIVFAVREYEAWFLASAETLQDGIPIFEQNPEGFRDAKGRLETHLSMEFGYSETQDQPRFSARLDPSRAYARCRSYRKLVKDFKYLLTQCGCEPGEWDPAGNGVQRPL